VSPPSSPTATGVVVGSIDTGEKYRHEALKHNWRSNKGWFNPYNGMVIVTPVDSAQQGNHTIRTMVGGNGIGVAPEAQWISCLGLYGNSGSSEVLVAFGRFMLCPTRLDGTPPPNGDLPRVQLSVRGHGHVVARGSPTSPPRLLHKSADALNLSWYLKMAGTSMAAPHIAGVVALLKSAGVRLELR
ncbi:hypothetical protein DYB30_012229, partial [Aphanomyces astaci]